MPRDGGGVYSKPSGSTAISGTTIESAMFNTLIDDIVADLNAARPITAGGTGATTAAAARANLGIKSPLKAIDTTGSSNAYVLATSDSLVPDDGDTVAIKANHTNTGAATLNVDATGAKAIKKIVVGAATALAAGDIKINGHYLLSYDSAATAWIIYNPHSVADTLNSINDLTGLDTTLVTGTAGASGMMSQWNADGDLVAPATDLNANSQKIINVVDPTADQHAATKKYVDDTIVATPVVTRQTAQSASGTAVDFIDIEAGTSIIKLAASAVSMSGTDEIMIQLGGASGFKVTGYKSTSTNFSSSQTETIGFILNAAGAAAVAYSGELELVRIDGNEWILRGNMFEDTTAVQYLSQGKVTLSEELTQIRFRGNTTNTFDGGKFNILEMS